MTLPPDYAERVYAGVLGKIIGVYLGRPFEGWTYQRILQELGEVQYYVHERLNKPLVVTDDDITGTFTFLRALPDSGNRKDITPAQIGDAWMNYIIENRSILWWGGMGNSTEHTAFLRMKQGVRAPRSGSCELNGKVVSEQIGAQIFIDGWAMAAPGDPELAADLARRAGSVSHDGEALYGAQVLAAMEALAFVEPDLNRLIDTAVRLIPRDSVIYRLIADIREWHAELRDWRQARQKIEENYGYDQYGSNCHMVPNHALVHLGLLYGEDDFQKTLMITNTSGWDTDCNSGNVGCLMGIKNGLSGLEAGPDWRAPVADRIYLPTADSGRVISDAAREAIEIANVGRALAGEDCLAPKNGARFNFEFPGSVQGFQAERSSEARGTLSVENAAGHSLFGRRCLALRYRGVAHMRPARAATPTCIPPDAAGMTGYTLMAAPTLYSGQVVRGRLSADSLDTEAVEARVFIRYYGDQDEPVRVYGPNQWMQPGAAWEFQWKVPDTGGCPIFEVGIELSAAARRDGTLYLDYLTWEGDPEIVFAEIKAGAMHQRAWVDGVSALFFRPPGLMRLVQNEGCGMVMTGTREWRDYTVEVNLTPHMVEKFGLAARVQGVRRFIALEVTRGGKARLVKQWDSAERVLAEADCPLEFGRTYRLRLQVKGELAAAWIDGSPAFSAPVDIPSGGIGLRCAEGRLGVEWLKVNPAG